MSEPLTDYVEPETVDEPAIWDDAVEEWENPWDESEDE